MKCLRYPDCSSVRGCIHTGSKQQKEFLLTDFSKHFHPAPLEDPSKIFENIVCISSEGQLVRNQELNDGQPCQQKMLFVFLSSQIFTLLNTCTTTPGKIASKALAGSTYSTVINSPQS